MTPNAFAWIKFVSHFTSATNTSEIEIDNGDIIYTGNQLITTASNLFKRMKKIR